MIAFPSPIPKEAGCLCVHVKTVAHGPVQCSANAPAAMAGAYWAPTHSWQVFFWCDGSVFRCRHLLCTEGVRKPWDLEAVLRHVAEHHNSWEIVKSSHTLP